MRTIAAAMLAFAASPALAQADANLAPGGIVGGARAGINAAGGTSPEGAPTPGGTKQGEGEQAATAGSKMVRQGETGARAPARADAADRP